MPNERVVQYIYIKYVVLFMYVGALIGKQENLKVCVFQGGIGAAGLLRGERGMFRGSYRGAG